MHTEVYNSTHRPRVERGILGILHCSDTMPTPPNSNNEENIHFGTKGREKSYFMTCTIRHFMHFLKRVTPLVTFSIF